jgi:hypothetical protein
MMPAPSKRRRPTGSQLYFLDPRVYDVLPARHRSQLAGYLNLVAAQAHGEGEAARSQAWFAARLAVTVRTVQRWEAMLARLGAIVVRHALRWNRRAVAVGASILDRLAQSRHGRRECRDTDVGTVSPAHNRERARAPDQGTVSKPEPGINGSGRRWVVEPVPAARPASGWGQRTIDWIRGGKQGPAPMPVSG